MLRETPLNTVSQQRLQGKKQDLGLQISFPPKGGKLGSCARGVVVGVREGRRERRPPATSQDSGSNSAPPPPLHGHWRISTTLWPQQHRLPPADRAGLPILCASYHCPMDAQRRLHGGVSAWADLKRDSGAFLKDIHHTVNVLISSGLCIHFLGLS